MSLILDALKRSEQERKGGPTVKTASIFGGILTEDKRSQGLIAAGSVALVIAGVGAFLWYPRSAEPPPFVEGQVGETGQARVAASTQALTPPAQLSSLPDSSPRPKPVAAPDEAIPSEAPVEQKTAALTLMPPPKIVMAKPKLTPKPSSITPKKASRKRVRIPPRKPKKTAAIFPPFPSAMRKKSPTIKTPPVTGLGKPSDAPTYNKRGQEFEREGLYDLSIQEYTRAILLDPSYAAAYFGRGWAQEGKGNHEQAIRNFSQAIQANPSYGQAYYGRGWAHEQMNHTGLAIEEYAKAIQATPAYADAYLSRGILYFYNGRIEVAENDFARAFETGTDKLAPYALLWLYISQARSGKDGVPTLLKNSRQMNLETWPGIMISLFLEKVEPWRVVVEAEDADLKKQLEKECVAFFFLGQYYLMNGNADKAAEFFRKTLNTGVTNYRQYESAEKELRIMGMLR